jgi:hypothetical protein
MDRATHNALAQIFQDNREGIRAIITELRRERGESAEFEMDYFEYVFQGDGQQDFIEVAAGVGARATGSFLTSKESDFYGTAMLATARDQGDETSELDHYLAFVTRQGSDRIMQQGFVHAANFFGTGQRPKYLPRPERIPGASTMQLELQNRAAGTALRVYASMVGYKVRDKNLSSHTRK